MRTYYEVRGQRAIYEDINVAIREGRAQAPRITGFTPEPVLRFESLALHEAQSFATDVYRNEKVLCTIDEITPSASSKVA